jgi:anti-sigma regulatory factor (Ser/Thr protein kinase)
MATTVDSGRAGREEIDLVAEPVAVRAARGWLSTVAGERVADVRRCDLDLVITEVVANSIRHGGRGGTVRLAATPKDAYLCVQVTDEGPGLAPRPGAMGSDEDGGYGLFLVEQLTRRWGITREDARTRVWFEFDYDPAATSPI